MYTVKQEIISLIAKRNILNNLRPITLIFTQRAGSKHIITTGLLIYAEYAEQNESEITFLDLTNSNDGTDFSIY